MTLWLLIGACAVMTAVVKGIGPWALGGRELPGWFPPLVTAMVPALLAALVVTQTVGAGQALVLDARAPALLLAAGLYALRVPFLAVVVAAAATAALLRALA